MNILFPLHTFNLIVTNTITFFVVLSKDEIKQFTLFMLKLTINFHLDIK